MSKKEARKVTIIEELLAGRFTNKQAAELLDLSVRQVQRMKAEASTNGVISILHKNKGRKPANSLDPEIAQNICRIYQTELPGYNFCHATDVFAETWRAWRAWRACPPIMAADYVQFVRSSVPYFSFALLSKLKYISKRFMVYWVSFKYSSSPTSIQLPSIFANVKLSIQVFML
jgi:hypothetical protein